MTGGVRDGRRAAARAMSLASAVSILSVAPGFLVGGLAVQIGADLTLGPAVLGLTVAVFFAATSASSWSLGRAVQRWGIRRGLAVAMSLHVVGLLGIASSRSIVVLALFMAVGGMANGAVHPAANALLARAIHGRLGLAMGIKQTAMPAATMIAGISVPLVALTVGWRWVFVAAAGLTVLCIWWALRLDGEATGEGEARRGSTRIAGGGTLVLLLVGAAFGSAAGNSIGAFLVDSGVTMSGLRESTAGVVAGVAGGAGLLARVGYGWLVDRPAGTNPYRLSVALVAVGCVSYLMIAARTPVLFATGAVLSMAAGWAWPGLVHYAVVVRHRSGAAAATGTVMMGFSTGSFLGPLVLGQIAQAFGYPALWATMAVCAAISGSLLLVAGRRLWD